MSKDIVLQVNHVSFSYDAQGEGEAPRKALDDVSLSIERGSFVAIVGSNGSGKSTLAKHFNALLLPSEGEVRVFGMLTSDEEKTWEIRRSCGMVFQNPDNQLVSSIVEDDVAFGPENIGMPPEEIRKRVDESLKMVDMYEHRRKGPHLLSGGQKQRVAIAGVVAMDPDCVVFDEPTAMLDPRGRREIMAIIRKLHDQGDTVILITHFMEEAAEADRIIVMDQGKIAADAAPAEIFSKEDLGVLNVPFAVKLSAALRKAGFDIPAGTVTEEKLAEFLCR